VCIGQCQESCPAKHDHWIGCDRGPAEWAKSVCKVHGTGQAPKFNHIIGAAKAGVDADIELIRLSAAISQPVAN